MYVRTFSTVLALTLVSFVAIGGDPVAEDKPHKNRRQPTVSWSGSHSQIQKPRLLRISSQKEWVALWLAHTGKGGDASTYDEWHNEAGVPRIDFNENMVIAIFEGKTVNSAGFDKETFQATTKELFFRFEFKGYSTDGDFDDVTPYGIYVLPKSDKPIKFQFPEPGPKGAAPSGKWATYGRIAHNKEKGITNR